MTRYHTSVTLECSCGHTHKKQEMRSPPPPRLARRKPKPVPGHAPGDPSVYASSWVDRTYQYIHSPCLSTRMILISESYCCSNYHFTKFVHHGTINTGRPGPPLFFPSLPFPFRSILLPRIGAASTALRYPYLYVPSTRYQVVVYCTAVHILLFLLQYSAYCCVPVFLPHSTFPYDVFPVFYVL